ncbi:MAG: transcriptional repressor [Sedimentisphaerales bacterium]|nr:transcriptional repressor [Sedimentisphaerales bacterium]
MKHKELSSRLEDYLEAIYLLCQDKHFAHAQQIADYLQVSKSSVSWALNQLASKDLIHYSPYEAIRLTEKGHKLGQWLSRRHEQIKQFLTEVLGVNGELAEVNACRLEHVLDKEVLQRMRDFMGFLDRCPRAGRQWMKGFGFYCDQGKRRDSCLDCVNECRDQIQAAGCESAGQPVCEELPKVSKDRDHLIRDHLAELLQESGRPLSPLQAQVVELFMQTERHRTLEMIYQQARQRNPQISRALVEQTLEILCEHKIARALRLQDQVLYEHCHPESHHDHLYCVSCGAIMEFFDPRIERLQQENARRANFRLLQHTLNIYGMCQECIRQQARTRSLGECLAGETVQVVRVVADDQTTRRLADMGLAKGARLQVLADRCGGGQVMLMAQTTRLMLDCQTARQVRVISAGPEDPSLPHRRRMRHRHTVDRTGECEAG